MAEEVHGKGNEYRNVSECGCVLSQQGDETWFTYCPMHKAAPEMLKALETVMGGYSGDMEDAYTEVRTALAAARGQEV